jgi:hypothetical protein
MFVDDDAAIQNDVISAIRKEEGKEAVKRAVKQLLFCIIAVVAAKDFGKKKARP